MEGGPPTPLGLGLTADDLWMHMNPRYVTIMLTGINGEDEYAFEAVLIASIADGITACVPAQAESPSLACDTTGSDDGPSAARVHAAHADAGSPRASSVNPLHSHDSAISGLPGKSALSSSRSTAARAG